MHAGHPEVLVALGSRAISHLAPAPHRGPTTPGPAGGGEQRLSPASTGTSTGTTTSIGIGTTTTTTTTGIGTTTATGMAPAPVPPGSQASPGSPNNRALGEAAGERLDTLGQV